MKALIVLMIASLPAATARTFETLGKATSGMRLPASVIKDVIEFDCSGKKSEIDVSTQLETIRILGKNCPKDLQLLHSEFQQELHSFPAVDEGSMTSEFAYLRKGENHFLVTAGIKSIKLKIFRY